jgi:prophage regulatory protein
MHTMTQTSAKLKNAVESPRQAAAATAATRPVTGFLRLPQIIGKTGDPHATPPIPTIPAIVPVCRTTWLAGVRSGRYPQSVKLSPRVTVWRASEVYALFAQPEGRKTP